MYRRRSTQAAKTATRPNESMPGWTSFTAPAGLNLVFDAKYASNPCGYVGQVLDPYSGIVQVASLDMKYTVVVEVGAHDELDIHSFAVGAVTLVTTAAGSFEQYRACGCVCFESQTYGK